MQEEYTLADASVLIELTKQIQALTQILQQRTHKAIFVSQEFVALKAEILRLLHEFRVRDSSDQRSIARNIKPQMGGDVTSENDSCPAVVVQLHIDERDTQGTERVTSRLSAGLQSLKAYCYRTGDTTNELMVVVHLPPSQRVLEICSCSDTVECDQCFNPPAFVEHIPAQEQRRWKVLPSSHRTGSKKKESEIEDIDLFSRSLLQQGLDAIYHLFVESIVRTRFEKSVSLTDLTGEEIDALRYIGNMYELHFAPEGFLPEWVERLMEQLD